MTQETTVHGPIVSSPEGKSGLGLDLINISEVARDIWNAKITLAVMLFLAVVYALVSVAWAKPSYTSYATVGPAQNSNQSGLSSAMSQYAGAASLLGVNLGGSEATDFTQFQQIMGSQQLANELFKRQDLKPIFFGPRWNERPTEIVFLVKDWLKGILGLRRWSTPQPFALRAKLDQMTSTVPNKLTGYVSLSATGDSPEEANKILNAVYKTADNIVRNGANTRAENRIAYLKEQLNQVTMDDQRQSIIMTLSVQIRNKMMASVDSTYSIQVIDPPAADVKPTSPNPRAMLMTNIFFAGLIVVLGAIIYGVRMRRAPVKGEIASVWAGTLDKAVGRKIRGMKSKLRALFHRADSGHSGQGY